MFVIIWEFKPKSGREDDFESAYGPGGTWIKLFRKGAGYLGTELLKSGTRYLSLDRWSTPEHYDAFRESFKDEYRKIDLESESLTDTEIHIGSFTTI